MAENQMNVINEIHDFFEKGHLVYRPNLSIDCAIFGYYEGDLKVLLVKNDIVTMWCLPGGFVKKTENLDEAAARITFERTGIENLFLKQFKTFGNPGRNSSPVIDPEKLFKLTGVKLDKKNWLNGETVSVGFYAISDVVNAKPHADILSSECRWFSVNKLPRLGFDHNEMVREALSTMRMHLYHFPVGKSFLPSKFTLKDIKLFYEVMSGKSLHASNFPNKLISLGLIVKTDDKKSIGAHRSPAYYEFDAKVYRKALKEGVMLA